MLKSRGDFWPWHVPPLQQEAAGLLGRELGVGRLLAACLVRLGYTDPESASKFLDCDLAYLADPLSMSGMVPAVERLSRAVAQREPVLVYGDYDVDGVTSVAMLTDCFRRLGSPVEYYIPGRLEEGYGLHGEPLRAWACRGSRLVVTADCGINSFAEMELARELGLDLIVTDHHQPFAGARPAVAVLNPKQPGCSYVEKNLSGVGVAWTMLRALYNRLAVPEESYRYLDLVALGTIADVVPLLGENRLLVHHGLLRLCQNPSPGLAALARRARLTGSNYSVGQVAFALSPRLNAPGRLGDAGPAVRLLLATPEEAETLAEDLESCNRRRQRLEAGMLAEVQAQAEQQAGEAALVLWQEGWHPGVAGILAGRLAGQYQRPVVLVALSGGKGHGSARCVPGHHLVERLSDCAGTLLRFGGHPEAAGLTLEESRLEQFREEFCRSVAQNPALAERQLPVVAEVKFTELSLDLAKELQRLQPFGEGNPEPLFLLEGVSVGSANFVGNGGKHLQLRIREGGREIRAIFFGAVGRTFLPGVGDDVDLVLQLREDNWQGRSSLALHIHDLQEVSPGQKSRGYLVLDQRDLPEKENCCRRLAGREKLAVWVNTRAAQEHLQARLAPGATIIRRGEKPGLLECEAVVFYHLPYDRETVEQFLAELRFRHEPQVYLLYGTADLVLNEKLFKASVPCVATLQKMASLPADQRRKQCSYPLNGRLLERALTVLDEIGSPEVDAASFERLLCQSETFLAGQQALARFRRYQQFWWRAGVGELAEYLREPAGFLLPEGESCDEPGRVKSAN